MRRTYTRYVSDVFTYFQAKLQRPLRPCHGDDTALPIQLSKQMRAEQLPWVLIAAP